MKVIETSASVRSAITADHIGAGLKGALSMDIYGGRSQQRVLVARLLACPAGQIEISTPAGFSAEVSGFDRAALIVNGMLAGRRLRHRAVKTSRPCST
ncbi:hypothetical protein [Bosea sp. RAC05]|uniref:hypothetical protein n=1 Tax=Bosea sp. RAC05 TaxID=1842539 RepID=UPI00083DB561|nr:hypothetical protein [Bosea sp. RAC05]AOG03414.1 hypothetical protein BSY19_4804 [Bosea sp. RAC05]